MGNDDNAAARPIDRRPDRGFTVVELAMTISLLGIIVVPILLATTSGIHASAVNRNVVKVETVLQNAADRATGAPAGTCDYLPIVSAAVQEQGWNATASVAQQQWQPGATPRDQGAWGAAQPCPSVVSPTVVQRVDITISSPDSKVRRTIQVVKSSV